MEVQVQEREYYYAIVENRPGEARKLMEFCSAYGVNLINFTAFPLGENLAQLDFFPEDDEKLKQAANDAGIDLVGPKKAFLIQGDERMAVLAEFYLRLADSGINVVAANGTSDGRGGFGYILWVKPNDYKRAAKVLGI
jgi:hypothetical protein